MSELSVIIPCQNDATSLCTTLNELQKVVVHQGISIETLIIDDRSDDDTVEIAIKSAHEFPALHIRVLVRKTLQRGLGGVLRYGMAFARGRYCLLLLPDGQDPIQLLPQILFHLRAGKHLVQGSTDVSRNKFFRAARNSYLNAAKLILGNHVRDTTSLFRGFDRVFVQAIGLSSRSYGVAPEMTFKVILCGGEIEYISGKKKKPTAVTPNSLRPRIELSSYVFLLFRAALHKAGLVPWF
jgi:glycosyltransferase involved in cell wall biosynthesis